MANRIRKHLLQGDVPVALNQFVKLFWILYEIAKSLVVPVADDFQTSQDLLFSLDSPSSDNLVTDFVASNAVPSYFSCSGVTRVCFHPCSSTPTHWLLSLSLPLSFIPLEHEA